MKERKIRFNFVDVLIILLVAVVAFALLYIFVLSGKDNKNSGDVKYTKIRYVIQAANVDENFDNLINVGDPVEEAVKRKQVGTVIGVQSEPYQIVTFDYDNAKETVSDVEGKRMLNITIEANAVETDSAFSIDGAEIRVGRQYSMAFPNFYCTGFCVQLDSDSADE